MGFVITWLIYVVNYHLGLKVLFVIIDCQIIITCFTVYLLPKRAAVYVSYIRPSIGLSYPLTVNYRADMAKLRPATPFPLVHHYKLMLIFSPNIHKYRIKRLTKFFFVKKISKCGPQLKIICKFGPQAKKSLATPAIEAFFEDAINRMFATKKLQFLSSPNFLVATYQ